MPAFCSSFKHTTGSKGQNKKESFLTEHLKSKENFSGRPPSDFPPASCSGLCFTPASQPLTGKRNRTDTLPKINWGIHQALWVVPSLEASRCLRANPDRGSVKPGRRKGIAVQWVNKVVCHKWWPWSVTQLNLAGLALKQLLSRSPIFLSWRNSVLICYYWYNKLPQILWFKTTQTYYLRVSEVRNLKWIHCRIEVLAGLHSFWRLFPSCHLSGFLFCLPFLLRTLVITLGPLGWPRKISHLKLISNLNSAHHLNSP